MPSKVSYFNPPVNAKNPTPIKEINIQEFIEEIRSDRHKTKIERIRQYSGDENKKKRNKIKDGILPYVCIAGTFSYRADDHLIALSGYGCADFDGFESEHHLRTAWEILKENPFLLALFVSPSGNGIKAIIRMESTPETFTECLTGWMDDSKIPKEYHCKSRDLSRACFLSHDKNAILNEEDTVKVWRMQSPKNQHIETAKTKAINIEKLPPCYEKILNDGETENWKLRGFLVAYLKEHGQSEEQINSTIAELNHWKDYSPQVTAKHVSESLRRIEKEKFSAPSHAKIKEYGLCVEGCKLCSTKTENHLKKETDKIPCIYYRHEDKKGNVSYIPDSQICCQRILERGEFRLVGDRKPELYEYSDGIYIPNSEIRINARLQEWADWFAEYVTDGVCIKLTRNCIDEAIAQIKRSVPIITQSEEPKELLCVNNGILNLKTRELFPLSSGRVFFQKLAHDYNPHATCQPVIDFITEVLQKENLPVAQEFFGWCLYRDYSFKKALILLGNKDTGKSSFLKLLVHFIGEPNTSGESLHRIVEDKFSAINLKDKLLNIYDDLSSSDITNAGAFKVVTGDGYVSGEHKFGARIMFRNYAKLVFASNKISVLKDDDDEAYYSRWIVFLFLNDFSKKADRKILEGILTPENMSGLLNWALEGLSRLLAQNDFSYKLDSEEVRLLMQRSADSIAAFSQDCLEQKADGFLTKEELFQGYTAYCLDKKLPRKTKEMLGRTLPKVCRFVTSGQRDVTGKKGVTVWCNIAVTQDFQGYFFINQQGCKKEEKSSKNDVFRTRYIMEQKALNPSCDSQKQLVTPNVTQKAAVCDNVTPQCNNLPKIISREDAEIGYCSLCKRVSLLVYRLSDGSYSCEQCQK